MQQPDPSETGQEVADQHRGRDSSRPYEHIPDSLRKERKDHHRVRFDWFAIGVVVIIAAVFATAAHLNTQPAASLVPVAVLSATGCGLLVTSMRKLRTFKGAGVLEAALGGLFLTTFQLVAALTFPGVLQALSADPLSQSGFYTTWGLVALFSIVFSMAGAALGHLAFAPLRPLPVKKSTPSKPVSSVAQEEDEMEGEPEPIEDTAQADDERQESKDAFSDEQSTQLAQQAQQAGQRSTVAEQMPGSTAPAR